MTILFFSLCLECFSQSTDASKASTMRAGDRSEFVTRIRQVREGMTAKQVLRILGNPSDIRSQDDAMNVEWQNTREIWCYGTDHHMSFPTLGAVYIGFDEKVQRIDGNNGSPPPSWMFKERELRDLLRLIDRAPPVDGYRFDPLPVIQIVNTLRPLGKEKCLAVVDEYLRIASQRSDARQGLFIVLRVLFSIPAAPLCVRAPMLGVPDPDPMLPDIRVVLFPVAVIDDVPLLLVAGYSLAGRSEAVESNVELFRKKGQIRAASLQPTSTPHAIYDQFETRYRWLYDSRSSGWEDARFRIIEQLFRLTASVYRNKENSDRHKSTGEARRTQRWREGMNQLAELKMRWDDKRQIYTFQDGSFLSAPRQTNLTRNVWKFETTVGRGWLSLERCSAKSVKVYISWTAAQTKPQTGSLRIYSIPGMKTLTQFEISAKKNSVGMFSATRGADELELLAGEQVQAEFRAGTIVMRSEIYKP